MGEIQGVGLVGLGWMSWMKVSDVTCRWFTADDDSVSNYLGGLVHHYWMLIAFTNQFLREAGRLLG